MLGGIMAAIHFVIISLSHTQIQTRTHFYSKVLLYPKSYPIAKPNARYCSEDVSKHQWGQVSQRNRLRKRDTSQRKRFSKRHTSQQNRMRKRARSQLFISHSQRETIAK